MRDHKTPLHPAEDRRLFVIRIVDIRDIPENREHLGHQVLVRQLKAFAGLYHRPGDMGHLPRDGIRFLDQVREARRNGIPGHAVKFGGLRALNNDDPVVLLDRADPVGSVRAGPRKDHRHRAVLIGLGEGAEEVVNGMIDPARVILPEPEDVGDDLHIVAGRDHVDMIPLHTHAVPDLLHRHRAVFPENIRQKTLVVRGQVLDHDIGQPSIGRKKCQKLLKRLQAAC